MGTNQNNSWEKIQQGVKDAERLICQKDYNASMIKSRQTLEFMVKLLSDRAGAADSGDLKEMIDSLYQSRWISKATCEHYHKIRIIGNKAAHEGDANAYNANQAYHMLSQEVYTFANDYKGAQRGTRPAAGTRGSSAAHGSQPSRTAEGRGSQGSGARRPSSQSQAATRSRRKPSRRGPAFNVYDLLKLLIPILCIVLLFFVVKLVKPGKDKPKPTQETTTEAVSQEPTEASTEAPTEAPVVYKTTDVLNVRSQPSTDADRIGQLEAGATVDYVRAHDDTWAVINYNGQEAYVSSQYLTSE